MIKYGLADTKDVNELAIRLESLRESWEIYAQDFTGDLINKRKVIFQNSVIECA